MRNSKPRAKNSEGSFDQGDGLKAPVTQQQLHYHVYTHVPMNDGDPDIVGFDIDITSFF